MTDLSSIKILHLDTNHPLLWEQLRQAGFTNEADFTSTKEEVEAKIHNYHGVIIRSRFKIDKTFLDKATNLQFVAGIHTHSGTCCDGSSWPFLCLPNL